MQRLAVFAFFLAVQSTMAARSRAKVDPLGRVLSLMDDLAAKIKKDGEAEVVAYKKFVAWCDDAAANKKFEIKTATSKKEELEAAIKQEMANADTASDKIEELAAALAAAEADLKNATSIRKAEEAEFNSNEAELMETIDTLSRALSIIEREMAKNPSMFAQLDTSSRSALVSSLSALVDAASFSTADKSKLIGLVQARHQSENDDEELGPPEAAAYKSRSGGIVDVLEDLKEKAEEQLSALRKAETNSKHNYDMLKQSLEDQMAADNKDLSDQKSAKSAAEEAKATATGDLERTSKQLTDAKEALEMAATNCMDTAANHEATVKSREEELKVIAEARKIVEDSASGAAQQTYSFLQSKAKRAAAVSKLRTHADLANAEIINIVKKLAKDHHSAALSQLASRISAVLKFGSAGGEDPFAKVKGLISDLIARLQEEASAEASEKAYCDEQLAKTETKKGELEYEMSKLMAKIDKAVSQAAKLKEEVKDLQSELATLAKEQAEMDQLRSETHADYTQAKDDLEKGLAGIRKALGMLREYYGSSAALVQSSSDQPAMPEAHVKSSGAGASIIGILEQCESDFATNLAKEEAQEDDAQTEYEKTTQENKITRTMKEQDVTYKKKEMSSLEKTIADLTGDRDTTDAELSAVLEYYAKVKQRCIAQPETYEERKARREAEIKGLKEALSILEDEVAFVQRAKKGAGRHHFLG